MIKGAGLDISCAKDSMLTRVLCACLAAIALVASLVAVFSGTDQRSEVFAWNSAKDPNPIALTLLDPHPSTMTVRGSTMLPTAAQELALKTFAGPAAMPLGGATPTPRLQKAVSLRVLLNRAGVTAQVVDVDDTVVASVGPVPTGGFPTDWVVDYQAGKIDVQVGETRQSLDAAQYAITTNWLELQGAPIDSRKPSWSVSLTSDSLALDRPSPAHGWGIWISLLAALLSVLLPYLSRIVKFGPRATSFASLAPRTVLRRIAPLDLVVLVGLVLSGFIARVTYDDGWILWSARMVAAAPWGTSAPLIDPYLGFPMPQGFLYESLLGFTAGQSSLMVGMRSLTLALAFAMWLLFSRKIMPQVFGSGATRLRWAAAGFMLLWGLSWMTLRAEAPIACLSVVLLTLAATSRNRRAALTITLIVGTMGLAVATHQTGLILIPAGIVTLVPRLLDGSIGWLEKATGLLSGAGLALVAIFFNQNLDMARALLATYGGTTIDIFNEWGRFSDLMRIGVTGQRAWFLLGLLGLVVLAASVTMRFVSIGKLDESFVVLLAAAVMPLGLLFTSSKWLWHYGSVIAPMMLGTLLWVRWMSSAPKTTRVRAVLTATLAVWVVLVFKDSEFDSKRSLVLVPTSIALCALVMFAKPRSLDVAGRIGLAFVVMFAAASAATIWRGVLVHQDSDSGWSPLAQSVGGLVSERLRCGLGTAIEVTDAGSTMTALELIEATNSSAMISPAGTMQNPCVFPPSVTGAQWAPIAYSFDSTELANERLPMMDEPSRFCIEHPVEPTERPFLSCFNRLLPVDMPNLKGVVVDRTSSR